MLLKLIVDTKPHTAGAKLNHITVFVALLVLGEITAKTIKHGLQMRTEAILETKHRLIIALCHIHLTAFRAEAIDPW